MVVFLIGLLFGVMFISSTSGTGGLKRKKVYLDLVEIKNKSGRPQTVKTSNLSESTHIEPGGFSRITIPSDSLVSIDNGENIKKLDLGGTRIDTIYLTDTGVSTNLTAEQGSFINSSFTPVQVIEEGIDGEKWDRGFVGPGGKIKFLIPSGTLWHAADPERKNILGSLKSTRGAKGILYDGEKLSELK